ncbi:MAG: sialidase family protein [Steroidobacteraceae bacterium]|jgi:hypothetical protein
MKLFFSMGLVCGNISIFGFAGALAQQAAPSAPPAGAGGSAADPAAQLSMPVPTVFSSKIGFFTMEQAPGAAYPRVIQLQHYAAARGQLLATFSRREQSLPIYRSTDGGDTWQKYSEIPMLRGQPALYELPIKMGEFPAGTVLAAGNGVSGPDPGKRPLDVVYSVDGGKTWAYLSTIAAGGDGRYDSSDRAGLLRDQAPVFEPYLYTDSSGHLVAYFSDERDKKNGYSQLLDHEVSEDGGRSWGPAVYDAAIPDGLTRPGMTIVTRDGHGKYYMSYEEVSMPGYALEPRTNSAHLRTSSDGDNWGDPRSFGTLIQDRWRQFPNGTPYIVWSPWGGSNGTLLVTGRSVARDNIGRVGNGMFINRNGGEGLWTLIEIPIVYNIDNDGYSQSMIPLGDGQEILQLVTVNNRVEYAKFKLPQELPTYGFPWDQGPAMGPR